MTATDPVYARALERREAILRELHEVQSFLMMYRELSMESREGASVAPADEPEATDGAAPDAPEETAATDPDAQPGGQALAAPVEPAATSPASAREPHICGSGGAHGRCEPASPPYDGVPDELEEALTGPQPAAPDEATADPANTGGADEVDAPATHSPEGPVTLGTAPAPTPAPRGGSTRVVGGMPMAEKCDRLLAVLCDAAGDDGKTVLTLGEMSARSGIPYGSVHGALMKLKEQRRIKRPTGGPVHIPNHKPKPAPATSSAPSDAVAKINTPAPKPAPKADVIVNPDYKPGSPTPKSDLPPRPAPRPVVPLRDGFRPPVQISGEALTYADGEIPMPKPQLIILSKLLENWGRKVSIDDLKAELVKVGKVPPNQADALLADLGHLAKINEAIKSVGLVVFEVSGGSWRIEARQRAGVAA